MMDYRESRERGSFGAILPSQPDVEPADEIKNVNWPHSSREHQQAVRWILAGERERWVMQEAEKVLMIMRNALLITVVMMMASVGWGQQPTSQTQWPGQPCPSFMEGMALPTQGLTCSNGKWIKTGGQAPLECGKYQHEQKTPARCYSTCPDDNTYACFANIKCDPAEDKCVDDMHVVTEREWVELLMRLKAIESDLDSMRRPQKGGPDGK